MRKKSFSIFFFILSLCGFVPSVSALVLNPAQSITQIVTVQPIIVSDNSGINTANFFGTSSQKSIIEGFVDDIWAQAGIDVNFLTPNEWNNTFANWGAGGPPNNGGNERPGSDLNTVVNNGQTAGVSHADSNVINMYFVNIAAGFSLLADNQAAGLAFVGSNGITQYIGSQLLTFSNGREVIAGVVAHELGHNLGLDHPNPRIEGNLMTPRSNGDRLNREQINTALASNFSTVVPLPGAVWLFGSALLGLTTYYRRKKVI